MSVANISQHVLHSTKYMFTVQ